ncbi:MAG: single-stranded-DNA-specific exonuclease RecJ, partial [Actinobacteria bacterium]|nr:single-stranded-DNA-specific exonuclease RecJ [Actinomycetota bacterium]
MSPAKIWKISEINKISQNHLSDSLNISPFLSSLLLNRGITESQEALKFLNPDINYLNDPFELSGIKKDVERIACAINQGEKICVYGDFDVDGITSTTLLVSAIKDLGGDVDYYIPNRFDEGYGLSKKTISNLSKIYQLVISVDCGITAVDEVSLANKLGLDIVITDHHEPGDLLPPATAVINPKTNPSSSSFKELAGVGVVFKLVQALYQEVLSCNFINDKANEYLDLVALGTIADVVPLVDENRILVKKGLEIINNSERTGLKALIEVAGLSDKAISTGLVAFRLAPRLNAGGRLSEAKLCAELLLTDNPDRAYEIASFLDEKNRKRQQIEEDMLGEAKEMVERNINLESEKVIVLASEKWHEGVKGIVASRLVDCFFRPTLLFSLKNGQAKGSARSISNFHIYNALSETKDLLTSFGGHAYAAGLKLPENNLSVFRKEINKIADTLLTDEDLSPRLPIEFCLNISDINFDLVNDLEKMAPFGMGNPNPVLSLESVYLNNHKRVGNGKHLKFLVQKGVCAFDGVGFNLESNIEQIEENRHPVDIAFYLEKNEWQGEEKIQIKLIDVRLEEDKKIEADNFINHLFKNANELIKDEDYKNIGDTDVFHTKIVGVTFEERQEVISILSPGMPLSLIREPENPYDKNAIKVRDNYGQDIGFLNARLAKQLAPYMDKGIKFEAEIMNLTGGIDKHYGINIQIRRKDKNEFPILNPGNNKIRRDLRLLEDDSLINRLREILLNDQSLKEKQKESIKTLLEGNNCLTIMGTGQGKSAIFQIVSAYKAIKKEEITIVVFPLRALVNDQFHYLKSIYDQLGLSVGQFSGDLSKNQRENVFEALKEDKIDIVFTTPEFLYHHSAEFAKIRNKIGFFVIDECHHICTSSESHRPLYKRLHEIIDLFGNPLVLAVTATANDKVALEIIRSLKIKNTVIDPAVRTNLNIIDKRNISNKDEYIKNIIAAGEKSVVYVNSREQTVKIANYLRINHHHLCNQIAYYNAGLNAELRAEIENRFRSNDLKIIAATSAFGEGVNIPDVVHIFLYHLNFNFIEFNQQSGRAGRNGREAYIHLLFGDEDAKINSYILESMAPDRPKLASLYRSLRSIAKRRMKIYAEAGKLSDDFEIDDYPNQIRLTNAEL